MGPKVPKKYCFSSFMTERVTEAFQIKSSSFLGFLHQVSQNQFIFKYVVNMDSEVTNPKYEIIWTNSSSDNNFFVCSVYDPTPQPEFGLYHISRKIFHFAK